LIHSLSHDLPKRIVYWRHEEGRQIKEIAKLASCCELTVYIRKAVAEGNVKRLGPKCLKAGTNTNKQARKNRGSPDDYATGNTFPQDFFFPFNNFYAYNTLCYQYEN
jgi:hypothetical protein